MRALRVILRSYLKLLLGKGVRHAYGQVGEDALIQAALKGRKGFYVDIGAYHPVLYSNTYGLYRRGWRGLVVDPNLEAEGWFKMMRPRDRFVHAGIAGTEGEATYYAFNDGALNTFSEKDVEYQRKKKWVTLRGTHAVRLVPLAKLLADHAITRIDFLNIDVEGMDMEVLESHEWRLRPRVIAIEDLHFDPDRPMESPAYASLRERGYRFIGMGARTLIFQDERS